MCIIEITLNDVKIVSFSCKLENKNRLEENNLLSWLDNFIEKLFLKTNEIRGKHCATNSLKKETNPNILRQIVFYIIIFNNEINEFQLPKYSVLDHRNTKEPSSIGPTTRITY